ncbi:RCC1 domain-containing protein, partial [Legionella waltersii]
LGKDVLKEIVKFATPNDRERLIQVNREFREAIKELETERKIHRRRIVASAGASSTFILTQYRGKPKLFACGENGYGQLGLGDQKNQTSLQTVELPKDLNSLEGVVAGYNHTLVFGCDSKDRPLIFACGNNNRGQLGLGHNTDQTSLQRLELPEALNSLEDVVAGFNHTLVFGRDSFGKPLLFACGWNIFGQLGLGDENNQSSLQPLELPEALNSLEGVVAGAHHTLVFGRDSFGKPLLFACGRNIFGQLGLVNQNNQTSLQRLEFPEALNSLEGVAAGGYHTLVFGRDSKGKPALFACGYNEYGQLGLGHKNDQSSLQPVRLPQELNSLESVVAGGEHTLVFGRDSKGNLLLFACGRNIFGQLGLGHQNNQTSLQSVKIPQDLNSLEGVVAGYNHTLVFGCDSKGKPTLFAFGNNYGGQLGLGHQENQNLPTAVPKPVICDSEKYRLKMAIEHHIKTLSNEFSWFGLKKSPQEKIKMLKQLCENLEQVDNANSKQKLREVMSTLLEEHKQTIREHRNPFRKWCFFSPESPTHTETFLTEKMNSLNT